MTMNGDEWRWMVMNDKQLLNIYLLFTFINNYLINININNVITIIINRYCYYNYYY